MWMRQFAVPFAAVCCKTQMQVTLCCLHCRRDQEPVCRDPLRGGQCPIRGVPSRSLVPCAMLCGTKCRRHRAGSGHLTRLGAESSRCGTTKAVVRCVNAEEEPAWNQKNPDQMGNRCCSTEFTPTQHQWSLQSSTHLKAGVFLSLVRFRAPTSCPS